MTTLRSRAIRLAHAQPALRPYLLPLLKQASTPVFRKERLSIPTSTGEPIVTDALVYGPYSIYKNFKGSGYAVTFTKTGQALTTKSRTLMDAKAFLEALIDRVPELLKADSEADIMRHSKEIVEILRNPPAVSGTAQKTGPAVSDLRANLLDNLVKAGMYSQGRRSGKAGDFFVPSVLKGGSRGTPSRSIAVGNRDVLLNEFDMRDEKWKMVKSELISKFTPDLLDKWVAWTKEGPSRQDLRVQEEEERSRARGEWQMSHSSY